MKIITTVEAKNELLEAINATVNVTDIIGDDAEDIILMSKAFQYLDVATNEIEYLKKKVDDLEKKSKGISSDIEFEFRKLRTRLETMDKRINDDV